MRLSIDEYAQRFNMPIATVHAKLRNKELDYSIEEGLISILLSSAPEPQESNRSEETTLALYQKENQQLKEKIEHLESKVDQLINDKEQMLRDERSRIEQLYQSKDEQLKMVLELIHTKIQLPQLESIDEEDQEEIQDMQKISLRKYLKNIGMETEHKRIVKRRFATAYGSDTRVLQYGGEFYLDLAKFDYSDLLIVP